MPVSSQSVAYGKRWTRAVAGAALAVGAALAAQGCSPALPGDNSAGGQAAPAVTLAEASHAWQSYRARLSAAPDNAVRYGTPAFYLPAAAGYPRWFVAGVNTTYSGPGRVTQTPADGALVPWMAPGNGPVLYLFEQASAATAWQLASESALAPGAAVPALAKDPSGHVPTVQLSDAALLARPDVAGPLQAAVVDDGPASPAARVVASGPLTTGLYRTMRDTLLGLSVPAGDVSQWVLEGSNYRQFALRTAGGGALVFYAMYMNTTVEVPALLNKATPVNPGPPITIPSYLTPLLSPGQSAPRKSLEAQQLLSFAAVDPASGTGKIAVIAIGGGPDYASASLFAAPSDGAPGATSVLITRVATASVVKVNRSLSQISPSVRAALSTAETFRDSQAATRSLASPCPPIASTSLVSAACAP